MKITKPIDKLFMWDEVSGEVSESAVPPEFLAKAGSMEELIELCASRILDSDGSGEYDRREVYHIGVTAKMLGSYGRNMTFAMYIGDDAETLARADLDAFPG